jgi:uncharacterized protein (DUF58 family)
MNYARRIVIVLLVLSLLAGAITGSTLFFRLSYLWGLLLLASWIMSLVALRGIRVERKVRAFRSQVGMVYEERYEVSNASRFPHLWIEVRDLSPLPGSRGSHVLTMIGGRESRSYLARARLVERGVFPLGPTVLVSGDLFGLFPVSRVYPSQDSLLVYPIMVDVQSFPNPPGILPGGEALRRRTTQITSNAAGVREYAPGDPLNRIHWLSTARRNQIMVKEFELDPLADVWIFADASRAVLASKPYITPEFDPQEVWRKKFLFQLPPSTIEYTVTIAASLSRYYLGRGRAVGLVASGASLQVLPSDRGGRQLGKILEALAVLRAEGALPLHSLVEAQARHLPRGSTLVMITSSTDEAVFRTADVILRRGLRPVAVLIDGSTFGGHDGSQELATSLQALRVPICRVSEGDDLASVLSSATSTPQWM